MVDQGESPRFHKLILNRCGITGTQAAKLFDAIGEDRGMHLYLSGNPIEDGIEHLAAAIHRNKGPAGLHIDMVEFKDEANYLSLIKALTDAKHISLLSLAGTAPSPPSGGLCSPELVTTLHDFFARNTSVQSLDLSGFCGKLDDSQLARGFGRSLSGLADNKTMTHLRMRNQNLHEDAGTLGRVLAHNNTLMMVDCSGNNFNLTSLRFLVDSLKANTSIMEFPLPPDERQAIWKNILRSLQRSPSSSSSSSSSSTKAATALPTRTTDSSHLTSHDLPKEEESLLRGVLDAQFAALDALLRENRARLGAASGQSPYPDGTPPAWPQHHDRHRRHHSTESTSSEANVQPEPHGQGWSPFFDHQVEKYDDISPALPSGLDGPLTAPYHHQAVAQLRQAGEGHGYAGGGSSGTSWMESPAETLYPLSEVATPLERDEEKGQLRFEEGEDGLLREVMGELRGAGFAV